MSATQSPEKETWVTRAQRITTNLAAIVAVAAAIVWVPAAARAQAAGAASLRPSARLHALEAARSQPLPTDTPTSVPSAPPSIYKAALFSALVPGLGEYYAGHHTRALVFGTAEAGIWMTYATFKVQEDLRGDRAIEFAVATAGALPNGNDDYYSAMGLFLRADGPGQWNEFVRRRARDTGEVVGVEYTGDAAWAWPSLDHFLRYRDLREGSLRAKDNATNMLAVAIVNRIASIVDVVQAVRSDKSKREEDRFGLELQLGRTPGEPLASLALRSRF